jgi:UDP:flavonoid glycosyltransferase YjiC (YdhE family)
MRCLITSWADTGHLRPLLPTAHALLAGGHEVLIASDPRIEREHAVGTLPTAIFPDPATLIDLGDPAARRAEQQQRTPEERMTGGLDHFLRQAEAVTPALVEIIETFQPDVIYREQSFFAGWLASLIRGVPAASFAFFAAPSALEGVPAIADRFRAAILNVGATGDLESMNKWLTIYAMPRSWIGDVPPEPTAHFVQPSDPPDELDDGTAAALLAGLPDLPTVYVTLGTVFADTPGLFQKVMDAVGALDINAIATTGSRLDTSTITVPPNARIAKFVPQTLLLPHCDAVVAHGGYGTLMGALRMGLPVVSVPIAAADNVPNAIRLEMLGAGRAVVDPDRTVDDIASALTQVLRDPLYRRNARKVADEIAALPPPSHVVTLLEALATSQAPVIDRRPSRDTSG